MVRRSARLAALLVLVSAVLGACYLPMRFDTEVAIGRTGLYDMQFDGYVTWVPLYDKIRRNALSDAERRQKEQELVTDLKQDSATQRVEVVKPGILRLAWRKKGDLVETGMVRFLRRNEPLLSLSFDKDTGRIRIEGTQISRDNARKLADMGLISQGELRVRTALPAASHNAQQVLDRAGGEKLYVWRIRDLDSPAPRLTLRLR